VNRGERRITFNVPAANGTYAPEILYLNSDNDVRTGMDLVKQLTQNIGALPAGAAIEVDLLRGGGAATNGADWIAAVKSNNAAGLAGPLDLGGWRGVRLRAKSGGTAGAVDVDATWQAGM
jgi:hypothetical protein